MIELYTPSSRSALRVVPGQSFRRHFISHAYKCQSLLDANRFGWDLVAEQVIVIENWIPVAGPAYAQFGMNAVTLDVGYRWRTPADLLLLPVPNQTETAWPALSALIDTHACPYPWFLTIRLIEPTFAIRAGTPLCRVIPVDRGALETPHILPVSPDWHVLQSRRRPSLLSGGAPC